MGEVKESKMKPSFSVFTKSGLKTKSKMLQCFDIILVKWKFHMFIKTKISKLMV